MDYDSCSMPVAQHHGHADSGVSVLSVDHRLRKRPLHFLPQHLIVGDGAPAAHYPGDPCLPQTLSGHHGGDVGQDSMAQCPGQMTQGQIGSGDVGHLTQAQRVVSLSQDGRDHREVAGFLIQGGIN